MKFQLSQAGASVLSLLVIGLLVDAGAQASDESRLNANTASAELVIRSEEACALRINGRDEGALGNDVMRTIGVMPGELLVECNTQRGQRVEKILKAISGESTVALLSFGPYERYSLVADGVLDRQERIVWARSDNGSQISWDGARSFCAAKGQKWRLPSRSEIGSLNDESGRNKTRWSNPYWEWWDMEVSLVTPLINWTTPCFFSDADVQVWCLGEVVMKPGKRGITGFGIAEPQNKRALCVRNDGARAYAGFELEDVGEFESRQLRLPKLGGSRVKALEDDSPGRVAGIKVKDIIQSYNGENVGNSFHLNSLIHKSAPGASVEISVFRDGEVLIIPVDLGSRE